MAVGRLAKLAILHARRAFRGQLHVFDDAIPADELPVGPHAETYKLFRRLE
jgi:hypothetical protein